MNKSDAYPQYQGAKIPWLDAVPEHWDVMPLFSVASEIKVKNIGMVETNLLSLSYGQIVRRDINSNEGLLPESFETYQIVEAGDIVFRMTDLQNDQRSLRSALAQERGIITSAYIAVRPDQMNSKFLNYLMRAYDVQKVFYAMGGGLRQSLKFEDMRRLPLVIPSTSEQQFIVDYLERETARIDTLIDKKTRFIELLKEKRQAVITKAVTKGLDDSVEMKDSEVEWIGKVPAHWDVAPFKRWFSTASGGTPDTAKQDLYYTTLDGIPWIRTTDLTNGPVTSHEISITEKALEDSACRLLPRDSVLIAMYGGEGTIGKNGLLKFSSSINQAVCALLPTHAFDPEFTFYYITFYRPYWMVDAASTRKAPNISQDIIRSAPVIHPPIKEQREIARHISKSHERIDTLIAKTERSIELLKEKRSALITAAVTGKIDVREAA